MNILITGLTILPGAVYRNIQLPTVAPFFLLIYRYSHFVHWRTLDKHAELSQSKIVPLPLNLLLIISANPLSYS